MEGVPVNDDPMRHLTRSQVPIVEGIAAAAWREADGDQKRAEELLVWKAISVAIPLVNVLPLARAIWSKSGKNFPAKPESK